jgi:multidrug efflux system outer membrane protein
MKRFFLVTSVITLAACSLQPVYERPAAPVAGEFPSGPAY